MNMFDKFQWPITTRVGYGIRKWVICLGNIPILIAKNYEKIPLGILMNKIWYEIAWYYFCGV